jgi:peptide chain release factor subunit 1
MSSTWESIEERERRVRGTRKISAMRRAAEELPPAESLKAAFAERPFINREDLREIGRQQYDGPVITLYLNFGPERVVRADRPVFLSVFNSLRHAALEANKAHIESLPHAQRLRLPDDLREVQEFLEGYQPVGARSIVILKSGTQLNRVVPLPVRVADSLTIEADPYIEPLEAILEEQHRLLVIDVAMQAVVFSLYELGYEESLRELKEELPTLSDPFRPGKEERHRETHVVWLFKSAAQTAERLFKERGCELLLLNGESTVVKEFEDYLSKFLRERLIARLDLDRDAGPNDRRAAIDRALGDQRKREEEATLEELGFYRGHDRLASGLEQVINAVNLFLVRQLVIRGDLAQAGHVCRNHHFLSLTPGSCPFDNQPLLASDNVVDELIEMARLHGVQVMLVEQRPELLEPFGGIAGILVAPTPVDQLRTVTVSSSAGRTQ